MGISVHTLWISASVLDELGLDRQGALELKLKASLHQNILELIKRRRYRPRDLNPTNPVTFFAGSDQFVAIRHYIVADVLPI